MTVLLLTGMSGVGKSTVLAELERRGFDTVDTGDGDWIVTPAGEPIWDTERMDVLLAEARDVPLFIVGAVANQGTFYPRFDAVVLLTVPVATALERIRSRTTNDFGKSPDERARIIEDFAQVEPLLRAGATHVLDATLPVAELADRLEQLAR